MTRWILLAAIALAAPAQAQSPELSAAIAAGQVGERYDGYMGFAASTSDRVRSEVYAINIRRRTLYTDLAVRQNVAPQVVGIATACQLLSRIPVGEVYMLGDGLWHRRAPGQPPPEPSYCAR